MRVAALALGVAVLLAAHRVQAAEKDKSPPKTLEQQLLEEDPASLAAEARRSGDPLRGALLFHQAHLACIRCHVAGDGENSLGPDLARFDQPVAPEYLIESVLAPSKVIRKGYQAAIVVGNDGSSRAGLYVEERPDAVVIRNVADGGKLEVVPLDSIEDWALSDQSIMPAGIPNLLAGRHEFIDLAAYLITIAEHGPKRALELKPHPSLYLPPPPAPDTTVDGLQVYRTMLPEVGPASFALGLGHQLWAVFDPQRGGLTYAWQGGLDLTPVHMQKINLPANLEGELFYRESFDRPLRIGSRNALPKLQFRGYRLLDRAVEMRYQVDDVAVRERIAALKDGTGIVRQLLLKGPAQQVFWLAESQSLSSVEVDSAQRDGDAWRIELDGTARATMVIRPMAQATENNP